MPYVRIKDVEACIVNNDELISTIVQSYSNVLLDRLLRASFVDEKSRICIEFKDLYNELKNIKEQLIFDLKEAV